MSRRGALTGGYYDTRKSRLDCQRSIQEVKAEIETYRRRHENVREELERILFKTFFSLRATGAVRAVVTVIALS